MLDQPGAMSRQFGPHDVAIQREAERVSAGFVIGHMPCVVDHVGGDDDGEPRSGEPLCAEIASDQPQIRLISFSIWIVAPGYCTISGGCTRDDNAHDTSLL